MTNAVTKRKQGLETRDIVFAGIFTALIAVCSWISIPTAVPFTLQTFAVFMAVLVLGGKLGTISVIVYIILGAIGVPVFANFTGGMGILLGSTGGYIIGFILTALVMWGFERFGRSNIPMQIVGMLLGLLACYALGTVWFMTVYGKANGAISFGKALMLCVIPFLPFDAIKLALAVAVRQALRRYVPA